MANSRSIQQASSEAKSAGVNSAPIEFGTKGALLGALETGKRQL
jgi:hypothetical protein